MVNTCLSYRVFAAAGNPAPRCNFARVRVNGRNLGLYVHLEELKQPFLARHFDNSDGNLYEGTISDFTPPRRGTMEKKTNEDEDDWSDVDGVVAALLDPSEAGLSALGELVDLDRFLTFWATEALIGHWDGYAGNRNNYHFYREPEGRFVFIPWGADDTFHLKEDPNPFDNIGNPPPSVLALSAIPHRLYHLPEWRARYAERLRDLLEAAWDEDGLLASVAEMAAIVQEHALPEERAGAAEDTERVRRFILERRAELLADITPEPPDWPAPAPLVREPVVQEPEPEAERADLGLAINEVAARGDPLDWFELYNASDSTIALADFVVADDLEDAGKRVAFPADLVIAAGGYLRIEVDSDNWAGFKLGGDEELGLWTAVGLLVDSVDWEEGDSGEGESYARRPDGNGEFRTVANPTPGAANQP